MAADKFTSYPPDVRVSLDEPKITGDVTLCFTDAQHVYVHGADSNDLKVGQSTYYVGLHMFESAGWGPRDYTDIHISRRWPNDTKAPAPTHVKLIIAACSRAVRTYLDTHADVLERAQFVKLSNEEYHLNDELKTAQAIVDAKTAELKTVRDQLSRFAQ